MAKQSGFQKVLRQIIRTVDGIIEKAKKMDRRFLLMIVASVVLLIVILALIIHSVGSNKTDEDDIPSSPPSYIQEEPSTDDADINANANVSAGAGSYTVDTGSGSDLNMRPTAGKEYGAMAAIPNGTKVDVMFIDDSGDSSWGYIEYNGKRGWVSMDYLVGAAG